METKKSLKTTIYDAILESIFQDQYKPGEILTENALVERFNVSKAPVREALITLCNNGVLKNIPRLGYEVIKLTTTDVQEILRFRAILECGCMAEYCGKLAPEQLQKLAELNALCCRKEDSTDFRTHWQHNEDFHLQLIAYAGNAYAYRALKRSLSILSRAYAQFYWDKWTPAVVTLDMKSHQPMLAALAAGNLKQAQKYLQEDLKDFGY